MPQNKKMGVLPYKQSRVAYKWVPFEQKIGLSNLKNRNQDRL